MLKRALGLVVFIGVVGAATYMYAPGVWTKINQLWNEHTGWTAEAQRADPVGFAEYAQGQLETDMNVMEKTRRELAGEVEQVVRRLHEVETLADQADSRAAEFRTAYHQAKLDGTFPIELSGAAYTEDQVRSQIRLLLTEAEGYRRSAVTLQDVKREAENRMEQLAVRISSTETELTALPTKIGLLRVDRLTVEGEELLAQVDTLMSGNTQLIAGNPVRTVRELAEAKPSMPADDAIGPNVDEYLAAEPSLISPEAEVVEENPEPAVEVTPVSYVEKVEANDDVETQPVEESTEAVIEEKADEEVAEEVVAPQIEEPQVEQPTVEIIVQPADEPVEEAIVAEASQQSVEPVEAVEAVEPIEQEPEAADQMIEPARQLKAEVTAEPPVQSKPKHRKAKKEQSKVTSSIFRQS